MSRRLRRRLRHARRICGILLPLVAAAEGCFPSADWNWSSYDRSIIAVEYGQPKKLRMILVGRMATYGDVFVEECESGEHPDGVNTSELPCLPTTRAVTNDLVAEYYALPVRRKRHILLARAKYLNPEIGPAMECVIVGTDPLILAFPPQATPVSDVRRWKQRVDYDRLSAWDRRSRSYKGPLSYPRSWRSAWFVSLEKELDVPVGSIAIFPAWKPPSEEMSNRSDDGRFSDGTVKIYALRSPIPLRKLFVPDAITRNVLPAVIDQEEVEPRR